MTGIQKFFAGLMVVLLGLYIGGLAWFYYGQEQFYFHPRILGEEYDYAFSDPFQEFNIEAGDGVVLNGLLFPSEGSKGLVFYLHGNAGALDRWGEQRRLYLAAGYDFFVFDYRGFGKSGGTITSEKQFLGDAEAVFETISRGYKGRKVVVVGYSMGTGPAAYIARNNNPDLLILKAPYSSLRELVQDRFPAMPAELIRYELNTAKWIDSVECPALVFHGREDEVIPAINSERLLPFMKPEDQLILIDDTGHRGILNDRQVRETIRYELGNF